MRIIIDLQCAQTEMRFSSIGRHSLSLAKALINNRLEHEIIIILSGLFPDTIEDLRAEFDQLLPQENIRIWHNPDQTQNITSQNNWHHKSSELLREAFIASLKPDIIHIMSLVEDIEAILSIGLFDRSTPVSVSLYDLTQLPDSNGNHEISSTDESQIKGNSHFLKKSSQIIVSSNHSLLDEKGNAYLYDSPVVKIPMIADDIFRQIKPSQSQLKAVQEKFGLSKSILLTSTDTDNTNNLSSTLKAYTKLPDDIRSNHQLVFAGAISENTTHDLRREAGYAGLNSDDLIFTGRITDDELVNLYNICTLFVHPTASQKIPGLQVLESMSCGRAVIAPDSVDMLAITGRQDILFEQGNDAAITEVMTRVLTDETFRKKLEQQNLEHAAKFSHTETAARLLGSFEKVHKEHQTSLAKTTPMPAERPTLAFISPLPPERSGISDYSAELIPELSHYYNIDVIVTQDTVLDPWINANCNIRSVDWLRSHASSYERVLYHFGNSPFHQHMFDLLEEIPGTVVLHDFFLANIVAHIDTTNIIPNILAKELLLGHGYNAFKEFNNSTELSDVIWKFPCSYGVLNNANGVIVHSEYARHLARQWYPQSNPGDWAVIPLLRTPAPAIDRSSAREALQLSKNDFVVCSFGVLGPIKLNHLLLEAWLYSDLSKDKNCVLIFVGENNNGAYEQELLSNIKSSNKSDKIQITGWVDAESFHNYLAVADICVQLRNQTRGESSAAILDCMNYGGPTIVNVDGSSEELPDNAIWKLPKKFSSNQLREALETLWRDKERRRQLGDAARNTVLMQHSPKSCAAQYSNAIESDYARAQTGISYLTKAIAEIDDNILDDFKYITLAKTIAHNQPTRKPRKQLLLDISVIYRIDLKTGIQRVIRAILFELLRSPPENYQVEPIYLSDEGGVWHYRYARNYTFDLLECPTDIFSNEPIDCHPEDIFISLDLYYDGPVNSRKYLETLHRDGIQIFFIVYDLLPVLLADMFPTGTHEGHTSWLREVARYDGAICISQAVADELSTWVKDNGPKRARPFKISHFHLGADLKNSAPSYGIPDDAHTLFEAMNKRASFLMVGTIEPRKGYTQVLASFNQLWSEGCEVNLVIIGKQGWHVEELITQIQNHKENGHQIFWLQDTSDEYLDKIYAQSTCLIAASEGEGFGLPLIEAAKHMLPIIARDIPIFREVAREHAFYFNGSSTSALATAIQDWLKLYHSNQYPKSTSMPWLTWKQSVENLLSILIKQEKTL